MTFTVYGLSGPEYIPLEKVLLKPDLQPISAIEKTRAVKMHAEDQTQLDHEDERPQSPKMIYDSMQELATRSSPITAEALMSSPVKTLSMNATVKAALQLFKDFGFRHVPVIGLTGSMIGIVSDRDVLNYLSGLNNNLESQQSLDTSAKVNLVMQPKVLTASEDTDVRYIARLFVEQRIGAIPITKNEKLAGIITRNDVLSAVMRHFELKIWV